MNDVVKCVEDAFIPSALLESLSVLCASVVKTNLKESPMCVFKLVLHYILVVFFFFCGACVTKLNFEEIGSNESFKRTGYKRVRVVRDS